MRLEGKVAVVAGSGTNMSRAVALLFAQEGARVYLLARGAQASEETAALARKSGGEATYVQADLRHVESARRAFEQIEREAGGIDVVSHHAGGFWSTEHDVAAYDPEQWDQAYAAIMRTLFLTAKYAVPAMERRGGGALITIAAGYRVRQMANSAYGSARDAQIGFVRNLARELFPKNVRVHAICPGLIWDRPPSWDAPIAPAPRRLDRMGRPEDVAYAALYLASDEAAWLTGQALAVEGGDDVLVPSQARAHAIDRG